jgi:lipopolysaccharide/colanic/teichoic acid biosynthesis glycosyltransferase
MKLYKYRFLSIQNKINPRISYKDSWKKRAFDIISSSILLIILFPIIFLACIIIRINSKGSPIFYQSRGGLNEKPFTIYKLRTLYSNHCDTGVNQIICNDTRVTKVGRWLRHYRIDEFPQLINVLKGDMSLVGPRPHSLPMDQYYKDNISFYKKRFSVKPGITGLAQIKMKSGEIKLLRDMEERILLDITYIKKQSLLFDISILIRTLHLSIKTFDKI